MIFSKLSKIANAVLGLKSQQGIRHGNSKTSNPLVDILKITSRIHFRIKSEKISPGFVSDVCNMFKMETFFFAFIHFLKFVFSIVF